MKYRVEVYVPVFATVIVEADTEEEAEAKAATSQFPHSELKIIEDTYTPDQVLKGSAEAIEEAA